MEVIGKVIVLGNTEEVGQNGFTKRVIVIETAEQYPQKIAVDFVKDKCAILDNYKVGDEVKAFVNVRGSEYNGRYFVNLQGWKIEKQGNSEAPSEAFEQISSDALAEPADDLPF